MIMNVVADYISCPLKNTAVFCPPFVFSRVLPLLVKMLSLISLLWPQIGLSDSFLTNAMKHKMYKWWCCVTLKTKPKRWCNFRLTLEWSPWQPSHHALREPKQPTRRVHMGTPMWIETEPPSSANSQHQLPITWPNKPSRWFQPQSLSQAAKAPDIAEQKQVIPSVLC